MHSQTTMSHGEETVMDEDRTSQNSRLSRDSRQRKISGDSIKSSAVSSRRRGSGITIFSKSSKDSCERKMSGDYIKSTTIASSTRRGSVESSGTSRISIFSTKGSKESYQRKMSGASMKSNTTVSSKSVLLRGSIESAKSLERAGMEFIISGHLEAIANTMGDEQDLRTGDERMSDFDNGNMGIHEILDLKNRQIAAATWRRLSCSGIRSGGRDNGNLEAVLEGFSESFRDSSRSASMPMSSEHSIRNFEELHPGSNSTRRSTNGSHQELTDLHEGKVIEVCENNSKEVVAPEINSDQKDSNVTSAASFENKSNGTLDTPKNNENLSNKLPKGQNRKLCENLSVPFSAVLAIIFSALICLSGIFIHVTWHNVAREAKEDSFDVSESIINRLSIDLNAELTEKIGLKAFSLFSHPEQTFKRFVNALRDGIYDPVRDRYQLVYEMIRAYKSTSYSSVAFESGYYLATGHFSLFISNGTGETQEIYREIEYNLEWLNSYNQPVYHCPDSAYQVRIDDGNWTLYKNERYVLGSNIHWSQALVEPDESIPSEIFAKEKIDCRDENRNYLQLIEQRKNFSGWFQDVTNGDETLIDATKNQGVGQPAFAFAELWTVDEPPGHFDNHTSATYNFSEPMWPDNNIDGNHTYVTFQNARGMPMGGITSAGMSNIMYQQNYDTRKRQWYQRAKELYHHNPAPPRGHAAYHKPVIAWFPLYVWQNKNPDLAIGLTAPLYGPNDEFAGALTTDISVKAISRFLADQTYGRTGVGFAVMSEDYVHSHGGIGMDEYINMTYNNHVGALVGVSLGSDYGKACGNDYTNNVRHEQHGPHYKLDETEWYNNKTFELKDYKDLQEMVLPIETYDKGGWECRLKVDKSQIRPTNRALPAENHEDDFIAQSARYIRKNMGGFDGLVTNSTTSHATVEIRDNQGKLKEVDIQWVRLSGLDFPGFSPLIVVVVPREDYMSVVWETNEEAQRQFDDAMAHTTILIALFIALTSIFSICVALVVTMPLKRLKAEFVRISKLDIDDKGKSDKVSFIREIASIQHSFRGMKMGLKSFCKFVPFAVVKRIVGGDVSATLLGVQKRNVTVMFADIANFTSFVEKFPLESVMIMLEEFLTAMVSAIEAQGGTIGDFVGDCVMAFWNSPLDQPDHAHLAVNAAFVMEQKLKLWNEIWSKRGLPHIRIRVGINSGEVLSGNIGSPVKMKFGVVGDTVNLASRVENLNKFYGSSRLLTDVTYKYIANSVICRPVDKVAVKGREGETLVYEPMAMNNVKDAKEMQKIADDTSTMLDLFWKKEFEKVFALAEEHLCLYPDDPIISSLQERARACIYNPPVGQWDGVNRMDEK